MAGTAADMSSDGDISPEGTEVGQETVVAAEISSRRDFQLAKRNRHGTVMRITLEL